MDRTSRTAFALLVLALVTPPAAAQAPLRVSVSRANGEPFVIYDDGVVRGGIARDIIDRLAGELGLQADYFDLPRARVVPALLHGGIDAACFLAPAWVAQPERLHWSPVLFEVRQVIVSPASEPPVRRPEDLFGKRLGTLRNYNYPELQPYFETQRVHRADAPSEAANLAKLERRRIEAMLDVDLAILHLEASGRLRQPLRIDPLWGKANPVHCAFSAGFVREYPEWSDRLSRLVDSGQIAQWIGRYTGGHRIPPPADGVDYPRRPP